MKRRDDPNHEVIIKRRAKKGHEAHHGGAWKVAFADFTLAMMALFMVLWIVQPRIDEEMRVSKEYAHIALLGAGTGIFDGEIRVPLDLDGMPASRVPAVAPVPAATTATGAPDTLRDETSTLESLAALMIKLAERNDATANLQVEIVPQGLRVLIRDDPERFMFARGSTHLDRHFEGLLKALAGLLAGVENKLIISGHTDATAYRAASRYDNWNLSGERALQARKVLVAGGLAAGNVLQVSAQADVMLLHPDAPDDGRNRRIELLVLTAHAERLYRELFGDSTVKVAYPPQP